MAERGWVHEVFASFQGEGPMVGTPQVFVRLSGCHLRCAYCDTPEAQGRVPAWSAGSARGGPNPAGVEEILRAVRSFGPRPSVSLTGGEPVLQAGFVRELALGIRALGMETYLETSGTLADRLAVCADAIDIFAFDIKLPSCPGVTMSWEDTRRCLELAGGRRAFVKIVVTRDSPPEEVAKAARLVPPGWPLVLQPATPVRPGILPPDGPALARLREACGRDVLVIPQRHVMAGWK